MIRRFLRWWHIRQQARAAVGRCVTAENARLRALVLELTADRADLAAQLLDLEGANDLLRLALARSAHGPAFVPPPNEGPARVCFDGTWAVVRPRPACADDDDLFGRGVGLL